MPGLGSMRFTGHCVVALILSGCYVTVPAPVVVSAPPSVTTPSWTATYRSYPVDEQWPCGRGSQCFFMVRLLNIETDVDQKWLRFNFSAEHPLTTSHSTWKWIDVYLDNQGSGTFLVDERGRQHLLAAATGLSAEKPVRIPYRGSSRFALLFPLTPDVDSFRYEAVLSYRWGPNAQQVDRVQIKGGEPIRLADFK